jgi:7-cyano-7-deazaguanine synthase
VKALVLLSGGQDSATCLFWAKHALADQAREPVELHTLSVYYGQRHATELEAARAISELAGAESHVEVDLGLLFTGSESAMLLGNDAEIRAEGGIPDAAMPQGLPTTYVPGRNLLFIAAAAARAGAIGADVVVTGVCQTDYSGYPDCRQTFVNALQAALDEAWPSTEVGGMPLRRSPRIVTPLMRLTKAETVTMMVGFACRENKGAWWATAPWRALGRSVTCYRGLRPGCGSCPACILRASGFADNGVDDPAQVGAFTASQGAEGRELVEALRDGIKV